MTQEQLYLPNKQISNEKPRSAEKVSFGSTQKSLLMRAMVDSYSLDKGVSDNASNYTTRYSNEDGVRKLLFEEVRPQEIDQFFQSYLENPKQALGTIRLNLINIVRDESISLEQRKDRLERYLKAYLEIIPKLDQYAFPPSEKSEVQQGVPAYIPDGLSDMGGDKDINAERRMREKIRVDKKRSFQKIFESLFDALWELGSMKIDPTSSSAKIFLAKHVMATVYQDMKYDYKNQAVLPRDRSIRVDEFVKAESPASVCRHIAMETQLRFQALGLESRLLKCTMDGEAHVANLLRVNGQWYLVDSTNPEIDSENPNVGKVYARPIELTEEPNQTWKLDRFTKDSSGQIIKKSVVYTSRNNMYYRILSNQDNPAE